MQMAKSTIETERKFDVPSDFHVPPLDEALHGGLRVVDSEAPLVLEALYFDTDDLRLSRQGVSLRRRAGGYDAGWHLKLPTGEQHTRVELQQRLGESGPDTVPVELAHLAFARTRGAPLVPVARLRTARRARRVLDRDGSLLAEIDDDEVTAERIGDGAVVSWREIEVETRPAGERIAPRLERLLIDAGARPADGDPKVVRALRGSSGELSAPTPDPAEDPLSVRLRVQYEELLVRDVDVRRELHDGVHQMRVALRRLRSCLRTFRPLFEAEAADRLGEELAWLAGSLGACRDAEVVRERLLADLAGLPAVHVLGPVRASLGDDLLGIELAARAEAFETLRSPRYGALLDLLSAFVAAPPYRERPKRARLRSLLADELGRVDRAAVRAEGERGAERELALHEVRKAAKRARYGAEALAPIEGGPARRLAAVYSELQSVLGERHDSTVLIDILRAHGARAGVRPSENGYTYGLLVGLELARVAGSDADIASALARTRRPNVRDFLR